MAKQTAPPDPIVIELAAIKKLLIGLLMQAGATQDDVAKILGINRGTVSRMFSPGFAKGIARVAALRGGAEKEAE